MRNVYYLIWVDIITSARKHHPDRVDWKYSLFVLITMCNALNLYTVYIWLKFFGVISYLIKIDIFPVPILNSATGFIVQFAAPFIVLNYFLIFYKERYKRLIEKYQPPKAKLALIYTFCSIWIGFASMILYGALR